MKRGPNSLYRRLKSVEYALTRDRRAIIEFLRTPFPGDLSLRERIAMIVRFFQITNAVRAYHTQDEQLRVATEILKRAGQPGLTVVECGAAKGASTAKLSLAVKRAGGRLLVFDSFRGIPENDERHTHLDGRTIVFRAGAFTGRLAAVKKVIEREGVIDVCELHKGWFDETLPKLDPALEVDVVLLDVDLLSSTRTCIRELFPRLRPGGVLFTTDGHLVAIVELLRDERFWRDEVGVEPPRAIPGLGVEKMLAIEKA
ncbi:class I SAM-dependent methyltransferase [Myxococcota bacterium]|nr:class I SAM-dependent methyltransferase [Myxococcota bacterium]